MSKRPLEIDMCAGSQLRDTQDEMLSVDGADISEMLAGRGRLNDNHGKGFFNCIGKVIAAKKIFKSEDCEDDRQRYYWEKVKSPYIYVRGELFDDEDHPNARAAAAILRNIHKSDCPLKIKASVEGGVVARGISDKSLLAKTKIHSVALTFVPANQATLVEPLNLEKSTDKDADELLIKSVLHLAQTTVPSFRHITRDASAARVEQNINTILEMMGNDEEFVDLKKALVQESLQIKISHNVHMIHELVSKALTAGYGGAGSPTNMTGGSVMQSESLETGPKSFRYITCDECGKEQVYGKFQVKCRECGKTFSLAKLENFFRTKG